MSYNLYIMGMDNIIVTHVKPRGPQREYSPKQQTQKLNLMSSCIAFAELLLLMGWINVTCKQQ